MSLQKYILMNQNIEVLDFNFDEELNIITEIFNIYNIDYAPYKLKTEYDRTNNVDRLTINNWYTGRGIPVHRDNIKDIVEQFNIDTTKELINKHFALSLSDQYWVKPADLPIKWEDINNFGIIRDANTLEWISVCPIFDIGRSMNTNVTNTYWDFKLGEVKCFTPTLIPSEILPEFFTITINQMQIQKLKELVKEYETILKEYREYTNLSEEQAQKLVNGLNERITIFENTMKQKGLIN